MAPKKKKRANPVAWPLVDARANTGKDVHIPGHFWNNCAKGDEEKLFPSTILDYSALHSFISGPPSQAVCCVEKGTGERFWIRYPVPFLDFWYSTYPLQEEEEDAAAATPPPKKRAIKHKTSGIRFSQKSHVGLWTLA